MIPFFKKKKSNINSISIPDFGWKKEKSSKNIIQWINHEQTMALSLNYFDTEPDLPSLKEIDIVRSFYREQIVQHNGGLVQVDFTEIENIKTIQTIFKIPQEPSGMVYLASLTIPFQNCSYVIKIEAPEIGATGMRDAMIADLLMKKGVLNIGKSGAENWFSDPYDKNFNGGTQMNKSEEPIYDNDFADHPLTQARKLISKIEQEIELKKELKLLKKFEK